MTNELYYLMQRRRDTSDALPAYTMRHDPRVHAVQETDGRIAVLANEQSMKSRKPGSVLTN